MSSTSAGPAAPECGYQQTTNSDKCGEDLFVPSKIYHLDKVQRASVQRIRKTAPKPHLTKPANIFFTQLFNNWLEWFLSLPQVKSQISESPPEPLSDVFIVDYHQSKARKKIWNLNFLLIGITLWAINSQVNNTPWVITIFHLPFWVMDNLLQLNNRIRIRTHQFPKGRKLYVKLAVLIGDVVATQKIDHGKLQIGSLQQGKTTLVQAQKWCNLESEASRTQVFQENVVQWSELNHLPYWDPVMNILLGIMHNWYAGVLQHHFQFCR
ncbi:hypothetical protein VP01_1272g4 [Puccinia sorghi]|uniref:Uncharacterized protein n=1 Tax=Puccinia sorghi TaxID=27349 RepID=A0A0L6VNX6_9BASI|nr:hypothetical protein VP01_1272g4 [Puccinia sorghi]